MARRTTRILLPRGAVFRNTGRAYALYLGTVVVIGLTALGAFFTHEIIHNSAMVEREGRSAVQTFASTIGMMRSADDLPAVRRMMEDTLRIYPPLDSVRFASVSGVSLEVAQTVNGTPTLLRSPEWLQQLTANYLPPVHHTVSTADGRELGMIQLEFSPKEIAGELWSRLEVALLLGAWTLALGLYILRSALGRLLDPLERVSIFASGLEQGPADPTILLQGKIPRELQLTFDLLAATTTRLQKDLHERELSVAILRNVLGKLTPQNPLREHLQTDDVNALSLKIDQLIAQRDHAQVQSRLQALLSHNIRSPLSVLTGDADTLASHVGLLSQADAQKLADRVSRAASKVLKLVEDATLLARLSSGTDSINPRRVNLRAALENSVWEARRRTNLNNPVEIRLEPNHDAIFIDPDLLDQTVLPIIVNAMQYSEGGKPVLVASRNVELGWILDITNHGPAIAGSEMENIFTPYFRGASGENLPGTGLGLSIAKEAANRMGVVITIACSPDAGTTFSLHVSSGTLFSVAAAA
jgi:signal transduction histidine kinase